LVAGVPDGLYAGLLAIAVGICARATRAISVDYARRAKCALATTTTVAGEAIDIEASLAIPVLGVFVVFRYVIAEAQRARQIACLASSRAR